ncbi:MAG: alpha-hydroxy acid oxidase [Acidobacteriota bacterium]|nr:MAG: alpha-hydroxy acid oxidase [Acidobacteriota bacterium]
MSHDDSRRQFLKYLAASPALAYAQSTRRYAGLGDGLISSPEHAINVFDFESVAKSVLPPAHWGYLKTSIDDDATIRRNREGFTYYQLRPRRLIDVRHIDMSTELFGRKWPTPIVIAPTGGNQAFHADGELAVARAARAKNHLQVLSTVASTSIEDVIDARGEPVWYQLYPIYDWNVTKKMVKRAEAGGCPAVALTVDNTMGSNRETVKRFAKLDERDCSVCHTTERIAPMHEGLDIPERTDYRMSIDWEFVRRLRDSTSMKVLIKGIVRGDDAALAVENGVDGVIVSNHGARAVATGRSTIECLPEVVDAVRGRIVVLVDSGFRRGTDFFKALALGADAVCIGRPYLWGLASFGQEGVEAVPDMLRAELELVMRQAGTTSIDQIEPSYLVSKS